MGRPGLLRGERGLWRRRLLRRVRDRGRMTHRLPARGAKIRAFAHPCAALYTEHKILYSVLWCTYIDWMPMRPGPVILARLILVPPKKPVLNF